jgi:hypothetical protein
MFSRAYREENQNGEEIVRIISAFLPASRLSSRLVFFDATI